MRLFVAFLIAVTLAGPLSACGRKTPPVPPADAEIEKPYPRY